MASSVIRPKSHLPRLTVSVRSSVMRSFVGSVGLGSTRAIAPDTCAAVRLTGSHVQRVRHPRFLWLLPVISAETRFVTRKIDDHEGVNLRAFRCGEHVVCGQFFPRRIFVVLDHARVVAHVADIVGFRQEILKVNQAIQKTAVSFKAKLYFGERRAATAILFRKFTVDFASFHAR